MRYILLILLMTGFVGALQANLDCPTSVNVNEEFSCSLRVSEGNGVYDVKVEIEKDGKTIARIFDRGKGDWVSAYYYLKEFIENGQEKKVQLKIESEGNFEGVLKLRQASKVETYNFEIEVLKENSNEDYVDDEVVEDTKPIKDEIIEDNSKVIELEKEGVIMLNSPVLEKEPSLVYSSKTKRLWDYIPYLYALFITLILIFLLWEKF